MFTQNSLLVVRQTIQFWQNLKTITPEPSSANSQIQEAPLENSQNNEESVDKCNIQEKLPEEIGFQVLSDATTQIGESSNKNNSSSDDDEEDNSEQDNPAVMRKFIGNYEKMYSWLYYSHSAGGFLCKVCSMMSNADASKPWESVGVNIKKHGHATRKCIKHENSKHHREAVMAQASVKKTQEFLKNKPDSSNVTKFNRNLLGKFIKILYFMVKKQWAISENFESLVRFLGENLDDGEIKKHQQTCGKNATYLSVDNLLHSISMFLEQELLTELACAKFFTLMADESQREREQLGLIVKYKMAGGSTIKESFFGIIDLKCSTGEFITTTIENIFIAKNIDPEKCLFISLDGANVMSGEHAGVQKRFKSLSPHCTYVNCRNHKLALIFVHLLKKYDHLKAVDSLLVSLWKLFHYSPKKSSRIFMALKSSRS